MAQQQIVPAHTLTIDRPLCVVCGAQMWLARVEGDDPTHDKRTFECPVCETQVITLVQFK